MKIIKRIFKHVKYCKNCQCDRTHHYDGEQKFKSRTVKLFTCEVCNFTHSEKVSEVAR